jgi:hypothetical protein
MLRLWNYCVERLEEGMASGTRSGWDLGMDILGGLQHRECKGIMGLMKNVQIIMEYDA